MAPDPISTASDSVYAVVVTFNPDITVLRRALQRLKGQVSGVVVVDNGSRNRDELRVVDDVDDRIELVWLTENRGIGYAHNVGIARVRTHGGGYVLILDQDSIPAADMVHALTSVANRVQALHSKVGAVGARYVGRHAGNDSFFVQFGALKFRRVFCGAGTQPERFVKADFLISSGTLFPIATLEKVGGMDEGLFIDHVDTEWFLRANRQGYYSYGACDALMEHGLGDETIRIWFGRWRFVPRHRPFRYYYMFRNSILLYKREYAPGRWIWNDVLRLMFIFVVFGLFSKRRGEYMKMMWRGMIDGVRGVTGGSVSPSLSV